MNDEDDIMEATSNIDQLLEPLARPARAPTRADRRGASNERITDAIALYRDDPVGS